MTTAPYHANPFAEKNGVCPPGGHRLTKGYRRVPGDTCAGGEAWDAVVTPCATSSAGKVVFFILVAAVGTMAALQFYQGNDRLEQYVEKLQAKLKEVFTSAASKGYSLVGGGSQPFSAVADDDNFYLNDDDFGPEPHLIDDHHNDSDSIDEAEEFSTEHTFQPLPPIEGARAMSMHVPVLSGPDGEDNVQDLLNIQ